jgi:hypothetical protein
LKRKVETKYHCLARLRKIAAQTILFTNHTSAKTTNGRVPLESALKQQMTCVRLSEARRRRVGIIGH